MIKKSPSTLNQQLEACLLPALKQVSMVKYPPQPVRHRRGEGLHHPASISARQKKKNPEQETVLGSNLTV